MANDISAVTALRSGDKASGTPTAGSCPLAALAKQLTVTVNTNPQAGRPEAWAAAAVATGSPSGTAVHASCYAPISSQKDAS